ncbi:hypothetical protein FJNA_21050 [Thermus sp. FJN-A]
MTIPSFDGTPIAVTVFQPALAPGQTAPLILHGHGFGGHRIRSPEDTSTDNPVISEVVFRAWRSGYYVISFDQRGFGDSGGTVRVMDPDYEVRDVRTILDWAQDNLPRFNGRVGTFGASYGGGFQLMTAVQDERIQTMVPLVTWYDLPYSLFPNGVPKTAWATLLTLGGTAGSQGRMDQVIYQTYFRGLLQNSISPEAEAFFHYHSPAYFYPQGQPRQKVDVLLVQGMRDTLFNLNEAYWNALALQRSGGDVRLVSIQGGHILPYLQAPSGGLSCGAFGREDPAGMVLAWFAEKLKGQPNAAQGIPRLCLSLDQERALALAELGEMPVGGEAFTVPSTLLTPLNGLNGINEALLNLLQGVLGSAGLKGFLPESLLREAASAIVGPVFVPLKTVQAPTALAGIPTFRLHLQGVVEAANPIVFVGVGVRRAGKLAAEPVDEQVLPLKGWGWHQGELVGVGEALAPGDQVGLVLFGFNSQYLLNGSRAVFTAMVSGTTHLPLRPLP